MVKGDDRNQVRRLHLPVDVIAGRVLCPLQVFRLHRGDVEKHDDEAMVAQLRRRNAAVHVAHDGVGRLARHGGLIERRSLIDALEVEADDRLRLAIFLDLKIAGLQAADDFSRLLVADHNIGEHQVAVDPEGIGVRHIRLRWALVLRSGRQRGQHRHAQEGDGGVFAQVTGGVHRKIKSSLKPVAGV